MKKSIFILALVASLFMLSNSAKAQLQKGQTLFDLYYGYSISKSLFDAAIPSDAQNETYTGYGPFGGRIEYMLTNRIGVGLDVNYRYTDADYKLDVYDSVLVVNNTYDYTYSVSQLRVMGKLNFHIVNNETSNLYTGFGLGYKDVARTRITNNSKVGSVKFDAILPVTMRLSMGYRYFVNENMAVSTEIGIGGGSFVNAGITYVM